jgi:hypothetical protein
VSGISRWALISSTFPLIQTKIFKGPRPFNKQKTILSGLTTLHGAFLDHGASGVEKWIAERPFYEFCVIPEWGVLKSSSFYDIFFLKVRGFFGKRSGNPQRGIL